MKNSGIILLTNVYVLGGNNIPDLIKNKPTIYRLSCIAPLTGYCTCSAGCQKWQMLGCQNCPQLGLSVDNKDLCQINFQEKFHNYTSVPLTLKLSTPSTWLEREVRNSLIGKNFSSMHIPTSVQLDVFKPLRRTDARKRLGIDDSCPVLLAGSSGLRKNKGFHILCEALSQLKDSWNIKPLLVFFGHEPSDIELLNNTGLKWKALGWVKSPYDLAQVYNSADIFISPSFQDNLPNTVNESLACGTPVVCFNKFSSEDVVIAGITGSTANHPGLPLSPDGTLLQKKPYIVPQSYCKDLAKKIFNLVNCTKKEKNILRNNCRIFAERFFAPELQIARYIAAYRNMLNLPNAFPYDLFEDDTYYTQGLTKIDI